MFQNILESHNTKDKQYKVEIFKNTVDSFTDAYALESHLNKEYQNGWDLHSINPQPEEDGKAAYLLVFTKRNTPE